MSPKSLVKIYKYRIQAGAEQLYLDFQVDAQQIYLKYGEFSFQYFAHVEDPLYRTEIISVLGDNPERIFSAVDNDPNLLKLFHIFSSRVLDSKYQIQESLVVPLMVTKKTDETR